ncbi:MAG: hypothetical protein M1813_006233 [Trichoglossum hirsutum]|nr:MAG: hypothetical protein M1813_006233 [Trichoglossum hirsutum]
MVWVLTRIHELLVEVELQQLCFEYVLDHLLQAVVDPIGNGVRRWQWQSIADDSEATTAEDTLEASVGDLRGALYVGRQGHGYYNEQSSNSGRSRTHKPTVDMPVERSTLESSSNGVLSLLTIEPTLYESDTSADELALGMSASVPLPPNRLKGGPEKCHSKPDRKRHSVTVGSQYVDSDTLREQLLKLTALHEPQYTDYKVNAARLADLSTDDHFNLEISKTIAKRRLYLIQDCETAYNRLVTLKKHLASDVATRRHELTAQYNALKTALQAIKKIEQ